MKKFLWAVVLSLVFLIACAGENGEKNIDPTGAARPTAPTVSAEAEEPTEALTPTPTEEPKREIIASVPKCTIFAASRYFMALREDGTVAMLGEPEWSEDNLEEFCGKIREWKDIAALCRSGEVPTAITEEGRIVVAITDSYEKELELFLENASGSPIDSQIVLTLEHLQEASSVVWAEVNFPIECITIDSEGTLVDTTSGGRSVVMGAFIVEGSSSFCLDRYGVIHSFNNDNEEEWKESGPFISLGSGYPVRTDGTVWTSTSIKAIRDWTGLASICESGGMVVGLKKDGTVVAHTKSADGKAYGNYAVEAWRDVVEVTTNGYYTVGRTSDGRLLCTAIPPEAGVSFTKEDVEGLLQN